MQIFQVRFEVVHAYDSGQALICVGWIQPSETTLLQCPVVLEASDHRIKFSTAFLGIPHLSSLKWN